MIRVGAQGLKLLAECLLSPYLSLFATPSPMLPLKAQVGESSTETGLATVAGSGAPHRARCQGIEDVERVPQFSLLFWLAEPGPQGVCSSSYLTQSSVGSEGVTFQTYLCPLGLWVGDPGLEECDSHPGADNLLFLQMFLPVRSCTGH